MFHVLGTLTLEEAEQFKSLADKEDSYASTLQIALTQHSKAMLHIKKLSEEIWDKIRKRIPDAVNHDKLKVNYRTLEIYFEDQK